MLTQDQGKHILQLTYESEAIIAEAKSRLSSDERSCLLLYALYEDFLNAESKYRSQYILDYNKAFMPDNSSSALRYIYLQGSYHNINQGILWKVSGANDPSFSDDSESTASATQRALQQPPAGPKLASAEENMIQALHRLEEHLLAIPDMHSFLSDTSRIRMRKYEEALQLTEESAPGEAGFLRGMEYFGHLQNFLDAPKHYLRCNRQLFLWETKMLWWVPVVAMLALALIIWFTNLRYILSPDWIKLMSESSNAFREYQFQRLVPLLSHMGLAIIGFGLLSFVAAEVVLFIVSVIRYFQRKKAGKYTAFEGEWALISHEKA